MNETNVRRSAHKERYWHAWAGTMDDLQRLGKAVSDLIQVRKKVLLEELERETSERIFTIENPTIVEIETEHYTKRRTELSEGTSIQATINERN